MTAAASRLPLRVEDLLELVADPAAIVDADSTAFATNAAAQTARGATRIEGGRLWISDAAAGARATLASVLFGGKPHAAAVQDVGDRMPALFRCWAIPAGGRIAALCVWDAPAKPGEARRFAEEGLGLTAPQARVAGALADGFSLDEAAAMAGVPRSAAETHARAACEALLVPGRRRSRGSSCAARG